MPDELRPSPVLAVGLTGHRNIATDGDAGIAIEKGIAGVLGALHRALTPAMALNSGYFSAIAPTIRVVTMGAAGADFLGVRAARNCGLEVAYIFPFAWDEYRNDFSPACSTATAQSLTHASSLLELPGRRDEGPRAYERANDVILSNIDLLVAIWDGGRARGRAGTGDVVQGAVIKGIPVIVVDPAAPDAPTVLLEPSDDLEPPAASDLRRQPLEQDLADFINKILRPPTSLARRQGLDDLLGETPGSARWRFEYPLLLKTVAGRSVDRRSAVAAPAKPVPLGNGALGRPLSAEADPNVLRLDRARETIGDLAVRYGRLFRSSSTGQYLYVILGVWLSGVFGLLFPRWSALSIAAQLAANVGVLLDASFRTRRRWQERWLDYRVVTEQLRWLHFRCSFGLGAGNQSRFDLRRNTSWTDWYVRRTALALGPPHGKMDAAFLAAAARYLTEVEIPDQIRYHRLTFRRLGLVERQLALAARLALAGAAGVAVVLALVGLRAGSLDAVEWKPLAIVMLAVLPATMTSLNGLRVDADLVRLVERSAQTMALLTRIRRSILAASPDYDRVVPDMERLASIMRNELAEWRFVIESRRTRAARRRIKRKRSWFHALRAIRGSR